jgi:uncharacterized protein (TIGR02466 family)
MKVVDIFKTPILKFKLNVNLKDWIDYSLDLEKNSHYENKSNSSGFHSKDLNKKDKVVNLFIQEINPCLQKAKDIFSFNKDLVVDNIWVNINRFKDYNKLHNHPLSIISSVFYVKTNKDAGNIYFLNNNEIDTFVHNKHISQYNDYNCQSISFEIEENVLLLFPSWLKHYVNQNLSNQDRISLSFNTNFKN